MKKQREPLRLVGVSIMVDGEKVELGTDPANIPPAIANKIAAIVKTLETGVQHSVIA
jgi:hypothetical protein